MKFANTEAFWMTVARAPLAFGAPRGVDIIDPPYAFAGMTKSFGKADLAGIIFCVAFSGQPQHAQRLVAPIKDQPKHLARSYQMIAAALTGQMPVEQALQAAQSSTERTMRQAGYPK